jgi:hypothetical protein
VTAAEPDWIVVAGGLLADPQFVLEKYQDDGGLSIWVGRLGDGSLDQQVTAAAAARPLPNSKVRIARVSDLVARGWRLEHTPDTSARDPSRHYDAVYGGPRPVDLSLIEDFISAFGPPMGNPERERQL